jgi:type IX secretion system PorP/SprF family membrane protein
MEVIMKKMKYTLTLVVAIITFGATAQQDPQYSMYMFNGLALNPAYSGSLDGLAASLLYRTQWTGIAGAPKTIVAAAHQPFFDGKIGAGLTFNNDQIGVMDRNTISLSGSYHLHLTKGRVSFGIQANYAQYKIGLAEVQHSLDATFDPTFGANLQESTVNFGAGVFYYSENIFGGISIPHIMKNELSGLEVIGADKSYEVPHIFYQAGYIYELDPMIALKPSVLVKQISGAPISADINLNVYYRKLIGVGVGYRTNSAAVAMVEFQAVPSFKIAYAYDRAMTDLGTLAGSTHEIMLRFTVGQKGGQISPRLF